MSDHDSASNAGALPEPVARIATVMSTYRAPWALCGGWAVDAWLGAPSREHVDIDIAVFAQDGPALFEHLPGWQLLAHDPVFDAKSPGSNAEWWDGRRRLNCPSHIHARPPEFSGPVPEGGLAWPKDGFTLDIQVCERDGDDWLLLRDPRVAMPLRRSIVPGPWQLPTVVPELLLFYKAADLRRRDKADFAQLLPRLSAEQRVWLRDAIARVGHPWLAQLPAVASM